MFGPFNFSAEETPAIDLLAQLFSAPPGGQAHKAGAGRSVGHDFLPDRLVHPDNEVVGENVKLCHLQRLLVEVRLEIRSAARFSIAFRPLIRLRPRCGLSFGLGDLLPERDQLSHQLPGSGHVRLRGAQSSFCDRARLWDLRSFASIPTRAMPVMTSANRQMYVRAVRATGNNFRMQMGLRWSEAKVDAPSMMARRLRLGGPGRG